MKTCENKYFKLYSGVGIGMVLISFIGCIYYNMIIAWSLYYFFASFQKTLPWDGCGHDFNTDSKSVQNKCLN